MKILLVTDSYPPEIRSAAQLMADLAEGLHGRAHEVTVATTMPGYNLAPGTNTASVPFEETRNGVRIIRIATLPHHRINYIFRGFSQILLPWTFAWAVHGVIPRLARGGNVFDVVIVHSPPLSLALGASHLARHYGAKFIANVHDIFPQNGIDLLPWWQKPLAWLAFAWMERLVYARADAIVVPSENHAEYLEKKRGVPRAKLRVIPHWIDTAPFDRAQGKPGKFRKMWGLEGKFVFFFGGVLGPSQGLEMVIDVAETFREISDVVFLFVGDGGARHHLEQLTEEKGLTNVIFKPFVASEEYPMLLKEVDVAFATLTSRNTTPAVPAKLMGYLAAGVPVVVAVHKESDAIRIVSEAQCGFTAVSDDFTKVVAAFRAAYNARALLEKLGANGRVYLGVHFTKEKLMSKWDELLQNKKTWGKFL